jgi:hypothetical protein
MAELLEAHRTYVAKLVGKTLTRINQAMDAHATEIVVSGQKRITDKKGRTTDSREYKSVLAGVDHYARMTGAKRFIEMIQAAREQTEQRQPTVTWEAFLHLYQEAQGK